MSRLVSVVIIEPCSVCVCVSFCRVHGWHCYWTVVLSVMPVPLTVFWSSTQRWDLLRKSAFFSVDYPLICLWSSTHEVTSQTLGSESSVDLFVLQFGRWVFTVCLTHFNCKCLDFSVAEQLFSQLHQQKFPGLGLLAICVLEVVPYDSALVCFCFQ